MAEVKMDKEYRYRCGDVATVLCIDAPNNRPVLSMNPNGDICRHFRDGKFYDSDVKTQSDLIEVKPRIKRTEHVNHYKDGTSAGFPTRDMANKYTGAGRIACVERSYDFEHGEGLE